LSILGRALASRSWAQENRAGIPNVQAIQRSDQNAPSAAAIRNDRSTSSPAIPFAQTAAIRPMRSERVTSTQSTRSGSVFWTGGKGEKAVIGAMGRQRPECPFADSPRTDPNRIAVTTGRSLQGCQERTGLRKIARFQTLAKPIIDRCEDVARLLPLAARCLKPGASDAGAKLR
jgi:hypothetical protein